MPDPRERIETESLQCASREKAGLIEGFYRLSGFAPWPEVVAFAQAILAADAEWREQNAPKLASGSRSDSANPTPAKMSA